MSIDQLRRLAILTNLVNNPRYLAIGNPDLWEAYAEAEDCLRAARERWCGLAKKEIIIRWPKTT